MKMQTTFLLFIIIQSDMGLIKDSMRAHIPDISIFSCAPSVLFTRSLFLRASSAMKLEDRRAVIAIKYHSYIAHENSVDTYQAQVWSNHEKSTCIWIFKPQKMGVRGQLQ